MNLSFPKINDTTKNYLFILPAVLIFAIFYIYPFYETLSLSFQDWNGISLHRQWIGFGNLKDLFQDLVWWHSMGNALFITLFALTFQNALAFALALACDREIRMKNFYRVIFFIPPVLSEVVVGMIWRWILNPSQQDGQYLGLFNYYLDKIGLHHLVNDWLSNPKTALIFIALIHSWKGFGWGFIMLLAGLQTIDRQLYEAAKVDGAGGWATFKAVTLPMMIPVILVVVILTILGSMQAFVLIISLMGGHSLGDYTEVPVTRILASMQGLNQFGYACAQGITFGVVLILVSFGYKAFSDKLKQA